MVRYQKVSSQSLLKELQSLAREVHFDHLMSQVFQQSDGVAGDQKIVVDKEYSRSGRLWGAIDVPAAATEAFMAIGSHSLAVVPQDGALSRRGAPPDRCARPKAIDNPGPVPVPTSFVEKNGSTASPGFQRPFLLRCGKNDVSAGSNAELGLLVGVLYVQTDRDFAAGDHCTSGVHGKIQQSNLSADSS